MYRSSVLPEKVAYMVTYLLWPKERQARRLPFHEACSITSILIFLSFERMSIKPASAVGSNELLCRVLGAFGFSKVAIYVWLPNTRRGDMLLFKTANEVETLSEFLIQRVSRVSNQV